jgi:hypothetical protein
VKLFCVKKILVLLIILNLSIFFSKAEINLGNSVEWLCADAGMVATGTISSYTRCTTTGNIWVCTFATVEILRGSTESPVYFTINLTEDSLKKYVSQKTPLLVFLKENEKPFKCKNTQAPWFAMETYNSMPALINLNTTPIILLSGQGFMPIIGRETILSYTRSILMKLAGYEILEKTVFMNYIEIPVTTSAFNLLYQGSACYLTVPDFMFPDSKEKL